MKLKLYGVAWFLLFFLGLNSEAQVQACCDQVPSRFGAVAPAVPEGMIWIPGDIFAMGGEVASFMKSWPMSARSRPDERPVHSVELDGFWMSRTPVTNAEFSEFIEATGYVTTAEKAPELEEIMKGLPPGSPPPSKEMLIPASMVFTPPASKIGLQNALQWWRWQADANWRQPEGPGSSITNRMDHPVVQVSYYDAQAYADWKGMSLPTEAQWEYAARAGLDEKMFIWGDEPMSEEAPRINIWQGTFPHKNTEADGFFATSPVETFAPNGYGLYDMSGNVWEWVADWYHVDAYAMRKGQGVVKNPAGPAASYDPDEPYLGKRVIRGGSFLCNDSYCSGYRPAARMKTSPDTSSNHTGFRVVKNIVVEED
jgi:formylglycine-generating enzyme required for sulfatase activity